jgi:hypothetical protein
MSLFDCFNNASGVLPTETPYRVHWQKKHATASCFAKALRPHLRSSIPRRITMSRPDLRLVAQWLEPDLVNTLDKRRRMKGEWHRQRKLATIETLWLMVAVSLDAYRSSLFEILRLATGQLDIKWSVSVSAFCKARARFSPRVAVLAPWCSGVTIAKFV